LQAGGGFGYSLVGCWIPTHRRVIVIQEMAARAWGGYREGLSD